jgi:ArsR family transcriptional regulator, arsenate/arsenite/antimonite-responsive transcriptional repressor / arsenate reductase (thioredoxin)
MVASAHVAAPPDFVRLAAHPLRWELLTSLAEGDLRVRELVARVGEPQNLVSYHLRLLRDGGLVTAGRSSFDGRDSYYHLDLDRCADALAGTGATLHPALHLDVAAPVLPAARSRSRRTSVLFVCTGNSARSPIAEALLRHHAGDRVTVTSAGTRPKDALHPDAVRVVGEEFGIDVAGQRPRALDRIAGRRFDLVVTLCDKAREACPEFPSHPRSVHWSIADPATSSDGYAAFRRTATEIDTRVRQLLPVLAIPPKETQP